MGVPEKTLPPDEAQPTRLFLKGGIDLRTIFAQPESPSHRNGGTRLEVLWESGGRADAMAQALRGGIPPEILEQGFDPNSLWLRDQYCSRLFDFHPDAVVLSVHASVIEQLPVHRQHTFPLQPPGDWNETFDATQKHWLSDRFLPPAPLSPENFRSAMRNLIGTIRERVDVPILALNGSSVDPEDQIFAYGPDTTDALALRMHRFNLALLEISADTGLAIIDVDRIVGELGATAHIPAFLRYSPEAGRAIRDECLRVIGEMGVRPRARALAAGAAAGRTPGVMRLDMPSVSALTQCGRIVRWYKQVGDRIAHGDDLVDIDLQVAGRRIRRLDERIEQPTFSPQPDAQDAGTVAAAGTVIPVRVTAAENGILRQISAAAGSERDVGELLAVLSTEGAAPAPGDAEMIAGAPPCRVAVNILMNP
jgi:hypothetical protein